MRYGKAFAPFVLAGVAVLLAATSAPATTFTSNVGQTPKIKAASEGHITIIGPLGINIQCNSTIEGTIESHGTSVTAKGNIAVLTWTTCTNAYKVLVLDNGSFEFHSNNIITGTGTELTVITPLGFNCIYRTNATDLGDLTESSVTGGKATMDLIGLAIPRTGHSSLCGTSGEISGSYIINEPTTLNLD